jgi:hypothetical protein
MKVILQIYLLDLAKFTMCCKAKMLLSIYKIACSEQALDVIAIITNTVTIKIYSQKGSNSKQIWD